MKERGIKEVKEAWEERLMAMPGVLAVGISRTKDHSGTCIKVTVDRKASSEAKQIPKEIEGYPVEVRMSGTIRPLESC